MKNFMKTKLIRLKNNKGFSLVEVLCAIVLLALIATPILQAIVQGMSLNVKSRKLLAASDLTSDTAEFVSSLVFEDFSYSESGTNYKVTGLKSFYWGNDLAEVSSLKLYNRSLVYPVDYTDPDTGLPAYGPTGTYSSLSSLSGAALTKFGVAYNSGRKLVIENVDMDGFKFDITIETLKPNSSGDKYFCYDVFISVREHGTTNVLSEARTSVANKY